MHAWVSYTSADTHGCRLHQEPLDLLPGIFHVQTLRHKLQRLERVVFVRSLLYLHSCPNWAPCSSLCRFEALTLKVDSKWFQTTTKLIRRDAFSANISLPSFHKNWSLIGWEKLHCWYWKNRDHAYTTASAMSTRNGKGAYPGVFLEVPTRVPPQGSLLDGHVLGKWWKICPRNSAYATNI